MNLGERGKQNNVSTIYMFAAGDEEPTTSCRPEHINLQDIPRCRCCSGAAQ